jgi:hypothetical protein
MARICRPTNPAITGKPLTVLRLQLWTTWARSRPSLRVALRSGLGRSCHSTPRADSDRCCAMHISTQMADCGPSLQARAIHPAGLEADIQATPNWAWRCAAASLRRAQVHSWRMLSGLPIPQNGIGYPDSQLSASNGSGTPILVELGITHKRISFHEFYHRP